MTAYQIASLIDLFVYKVFLYDKDKELKNKHCLARTDPRMTTFDGKSWTAYLAGEFVMYKDNRRQIAVSKVTSFLSYVFSCWLFKIFQRNNQISKKFIKRFDLI